MFILACVLRYAHEQFYCKYLECFLGYVPNDLFIKMLKMHHHKTKE